ncbi:hypothetical protein BDV96DRAFT_504582 [Lophiotrema nucula]|uniref:histidine kinase n=1 Tax=Lophiotrema nucula TaxID=690887 RepID=A0A6A5YMQ9_9PLEO|nr:hypothetical protein BDV96DRAFT_504582 [Lophiotrema nucula]
MHDIRLYGPAFRDIPRLDNLGPSPDSDALPQDHVAQPSKDSALMAFAQLASVRLGVHRAMISLIDSDRQYILAEATSTMSLRAPSGLWLGAVSIPRSWAICEQVLGIDPTVTESNEDAAIVINNLAEDERFSGRTYVTGAPQERFYAAVPLVSPHGSIVGALCVFDEQPRNDVLKEDILYLQDLASTVAEYLETYAIKDAHRRGEQLTRGLISFAEGASGLNPFDDNNGKIGPSLLSPELAEKPDPFNDTSSSVRGLPGGVSPVIDKPYDHEQTPPSRTSAEPASNESSRHGFVRALQESILPANSRDMFSRAANIIRASSDLDGVLILDASAVAGGREPDEHEDVGTDSVADHGSDSSTSSDKEGIVRRLDNSLHPGTKGIPPKSGGKICQVLGFSQKERIRDTRGTPDIIQRMSLLESDLRRMLRHFPKGKVLNFNAQGHASTTSESDTLHEESKTGDHDAASRQRPKRKRSVDQQRRIYEALQTDLHDVRSIAFVPFWDYERSRWFAGCLCWTNDSNRVLSTQLDLMYLKVFGNSIMNELARLDSISSLQAKASFAASVSHELRSPLHGILGALQFLRDTPMDSFQVSMLDSMGACGSTLLDTIDHILDHAKSTEAKRNTSTKRLKGQNTIQLSSKRSRVSGPSAMSPQGTDIDLGRVTEEVVEAVFSGQSFQSTQCDREYGPMSPAGSSSEHSGVARKTCFIVLDVSHGENWQFCLPVGSWRRIVMNIFGNAVKYTESGFIHISLRTAPRSKHGTTSTPVTLTITDTGHGISQDFLANKMYQPYSQENPHATGTGLGLSIVRQIIEVVGGKVEVTSDATGTKFTVKLALTRPKPSQELKAPPDVLPGALPGLEGRKICILVPPLSDISRELDLERIHKSRSLFVGVLHSTLESLKMDVTESSDWDGHDADLVILPEPSFDYLTSIRKRRSTTGKAPVTIFIAMDGLEASTLRSDARVQSKESVVEIMAQPCGPYKLANILNYCLDRYNAPDENILLQSSTPTRSHPNTPPHFTYSPGPQSVASEKSQAQLVAFEVFSTLSPLAIPEPNIKIPHRPRAASNTNPSTDVSCVLITDDNPINRRLLAAFMRKYRIPFQEAENGLEALSTYQANPARFDVILMDISMPVMDGMTATRAIREHEQRNKLERSRIIALTGLTSANARLEAWSSGIDHFMTKPLDFKKLKSLLWSPKEKELNDPDQPNGG